MAIQTHEDQWEDQWEDQGQILEVTLKYTILHSPSYRPYPASSYGFMVFPTDSNRQNLDQKPQKTKKKVSKFK